MSKKEILEALSYRQHQDSVMFNRLLIAIARAANISVEDLAQKFVDDAGNSEYAGKLNQTIDAEFAKQKQTPAATPELDNQE